jgi:hypothetical protein
MVGEATDAGGADGGVRIAGRGGGAAGRGGLLTGAGASSEANGS